MAKQRRSVVPAAVMHLMKPHWQAKSRAMLQANWQVMRRGLFQANSQVMRRALLQANSRVKTADWRPPLLELPAKFRAKVKLLVTAAGWRPPHLEPQD